MVVHVRVCGELRRFMPGRAERLDLELGVGASVAEVLSRLGIPTAEVWLVSVNGRQASLDSELTGGDRLLIVAPVAGG